MRILAVSDLHGQFDRFPVGDLPDADLAFVAGDLTNLGMRRPNEVAGAERWMGELTDRYRLVYYVLGNHDLDLWRNHFDRHAPNASCLNVERRLSGGLVRPASLALVGASLSPCFDKPFLAEDWARMTADPEADRQYYEPLPVGDGERLDVVLSHCPPFGTLDEWQYPGSGHHLGSPGLLAYIRSHRPRLVVCGHIHEAAGIATIGETLVVNTAQHVALIDLPEGSESAVSASFVPGVGAAEMPP